MTERLRENSKKFILMLTIMLIFGGMLTGVCLAIYKGYKTFIVETERAYYIEGQNSAISTVSYLLGIDKIEIDKLDVEVTNEEKN